MPKSVILIAAATFAGLSSCIQPLPPPPHFRPGPPPGPDPYGNGYGYDPGPSPAPEPPPQPDPVPLNGDYPVAKPTGNPDQVISPYAPYNVIDVAGFASGKLARDPSNQKIFRVP